MRSDDIVPGEGSEFAGVGPGRSRAGRATFRLWTRGRMVLLLGAIGLPWLPALVTPQEAPPLHRARGDVACTILSLAFSPDGATIATTDERGRAGLRPAFAGRGIEGGIDAGGRDGVGVVSFSPDGRSLAIGGFGPDVAVVDVGGGRPARPLGIPVRQTSALRF